jgi:hypothetical protein
MNSAIHLYLFFICKNNNIFFFFSSLLFIPYKIKIQNVTVTSVKFQTSCKQLKPSRHTMGGVYFWICGCVWLILKNVLFLFSYGDSVVTLTLSILIDTYVHQSYTALRVLSNYKFSFFSSRYIHSPFLP